MASIEKMNSRARAFFRNIGHIGLVVFGFMLVFFTANSRNFGASHQTTLGADVAHAETASCTSCSGGGCGSGGCSGGADGSGSSGGDCDSGDGGCGCGASG